MLISKITLGTAQLGMNYGIANKSGKPDFNVAVNILEYSLKNGIDTYDTSPLYGNSEEIIGSFVSLKVKERKNLTIISKLSKIDMKSDFNFKNLYNYIKEKVKQSLNKLKLKCIPIYLLHHAPDIYFKDGIVIDCLNQLKDEGFIKNIGISIYNLKEAKIALTFKELNVIQMPLNIFDQRLVKTGILEKFKKRKFLIFARSIYLQGLFFVSPDNLSNNLKIAKHPIIKLNQLAKQYNLSVAELAFLYVRDMTEISSIVVGAEETHQIAKNLSYLNLKPLSLDLRNRIKDDFYEIPEKILNPSLWDK